MKLFKSFPEEKKPERESGEEAKKYNLEQFAEIEKSTISLVGQLKERIDRGEYDTLISDDASGRMHALVLRKIINERNRKLHPELPPEETDIKTRFVAGGRHSGEITKKLMDFFQKLKPEVKKKALLVTEYIETGGSIAWLARLLSDAGIEFDIAADSSRQSSKSYNDFSALRDKKIFIGEEKTQRMTVPPFYGKKDISGVEKSYLEPSAHPELIEKLRKRGTAAGIIQREKIKQGREDVNTLANKVLKTIWGQGQ